MVPLTSNPINPEWKHFTFQNIPDLNVHCNFHQFKNGHVIFYEGNMPHGLFILSSGEVEITYKELNMELIKAPAFLGTYAFKNKIPYSGTAKVLIQSSLYFLSSVTYQNLALNHPIKQWINKFI